MYSQQAQADTHRHARACMLRVCTEGQTAWAPAQGSGIQPPNYSPGRGKIKTSPSALAQADTVLADSQEEWGVCVSLREPRLPARGGTSGGRGGGTWQAGRDPRASALALRAAACSGAAFRSLRPPSDRAFHLGSETCGRLEELAGSSRGCAGRWPWGQQGQGLGDRATGYEIAQMGPMGWSASGNGAMGTAPLGMGPGGHWAVGPPGLGAWGGGAWGP